jgi:hypothetical protein
VLSSQQRGDGVGREVGVSGALMVVLVQTWFPRQHWDFGRMERYDARPGGDSGGGDERGSLSASDWVCGAGAVLTEAGVHVGSSCCCSHDPMGKKGKVECGW